MCGHHDHSHVCHFDPGGHRRSTWQRQSRIGDYFGHSYLGHFDHAGH